MVTILDDMIKLKEQILSIKEENRRLLSMIQILQKKIHQSRDMVSKDYYDLYL